MHLHVQRWSKILIESFDPVRKKKTLSESKATILSEELEAREQFDYLDQGVVLRFRSELMKRCRPHE